MSYGSKDVKVKDDNLQSKYINIGRHLLKINSIELQKAQNTDSKRLQFNVETKPIDDENFKPEEGAKGQVGRLRSSYIKPENEKQQDQFRDRLILIAEKLGVRTDFDEILGQKSENDPTGFWNWLENVVASNVLCGSYAWFRVVGEEYDAGDNKVGISLKLSYFGFVASQAEGMNKLKPIDPNNKYDLEKIERSNPTDGTVSDVKIF